MNSSNGPAIRSMDERAALLEEWQSDIEAFVTTYRQLPPDSRSIPLNGGWSPKQIAAHLLNAEIVFSVRIRTAIGESGQPVQAFDPDAWSDRFAYDQIPDEVILTSLLGLRTINISLLSALPESGWSLTVELPALGTQTLDRVVTVFGGHVSEHLADIAIPR